MKIKLTHQELSQILSAKAVDGLNYFSTSENDPQVCVAGAAYAAPIALIDERRASMRAWNISAISGAACDECKTPDALLRHLETVGLV